MADASNAPEDTQQMRNALAWVTDDQKKAQDPQTHIWTWFWDAVQGDFNDHRSTGQIAFDAGVSMIPLVNQVCCVRDLIADTRKIKNNPADAWAWVAVGLTLIALFPSLGALVKGVFKIFFIFVRHHGGEVIAKAIESALTWVIAFLRKPEVQKYIREAVKADEIFKWLAEQTTKAKGLINTGALLKAFDEAVGVMNSLLGKVAWIPRVGDRAKATMKIVEDVRKLADQHIAQAVAPIQDILDKIVETLERRAALEHAAITDVHNIHFHGSLPEANAVTLMREAKPLPSWLSEGKKLEWEPIKPDSIEIQEQLAKGEAGKWPSHGTLDRFGTLAAQEIKGPARLYRIIAPGSLSTSDCWVSEEVFQKIMHAPDPRSAWRKYLAVWPDWNVNGQYVVYDVKEGETLKAWVGKTSSQLKKGLDDRHLEGGWEQVIFDPTHGDAALKDTTAFYKVDPATGVMTETKLDYAGYRTESAAHPGEYEPLRTKINHPNISGPFDTGWGYTDFEGPALSGKLGLPSLPGQLTQK